MTLRLGFLASHNGTNVQAIVDACKSGLLDAEPRVVISNNSKAGVLERARREGIPHRHLSAKTHPDPADLDRAIAATLEEHGVDLVVMAGYMKLLGPETEARYKDRILNTHPALLPRFGGKGMFGPHVHEAVLAAGETETGVTVHLADEEYDRGPIVSQRTVPLLPDDTPDTLGGRLLEVEHAIYVDTLRAISTGEIDLDRIGKRAQAAGALRRAQGERDS